MAGRFGRIPLDRIIGEWEDGHPINPRRLAGQVAALLRTLAPAEHPIHETYASAILSAAPGGCAVTHGALADFFDNASSGRPVATIATTAGPIPAAAVLIWRQWFHTLAEEAAQRAAMSAGFAIPANDSAGLAAVANGSPVARQADQPSPPSGNEPGYLKMRQAQQRREGERSAAEQLDAALIRAQRLEAENSSLVGRLALSESDLAVERQARGRERAARLAADERAEAVEAALAAVEARAEAAEAALATAPLRVAEDFTDLERSLSKAAAWFRNNAGQQRKATPSTVLLVVAGLLELLLDRRRPTYNQGSAADAIAKKGWRGAGKRQVNGVFSQAKEAAMDARAEATAKAVDVQDSNNSSND